MTINHPTCGVALLVGVLAAGLSFAAGSNSTSTLVIGAQADTAVRTDIDVRRNDNYGCDPYVIVGTSRGGGGIPFGGADAMRSLVRFDLSSIVQATLVGARLEMAVHSFDNGTPTSVYRVDLHQVIASGPRTPWIEGNGSESPAPPAGCVGTDPAFGVAWAGAADNPDTDAANNITQPDFASPFLSTATVQQATALPGDVVQWEVTSLVRGWMDGTIANYGLVLRDTSSDGSFRGVRFGAREGSLFSIPGAVGGPRLVLTFAGHAAIMVCHIPPDNPGNAHSIVIDASAVNDHLSHGDLLGACRQ